MEVWRYNGRQRDRRDEAFVGGGSGSKSNSILLVVRDSTPDCHHAIASDRLRSHAIACDRMRSHAIACDRMRSHAIAWWQSGVESRKTRAHKKNRTRPNRTPPHMNMSPYPQRLCPRSPWQHPPWTRVTAPHLPMSPVQALGGAARSHRSRSPCFGRQKGTLR